MGNAVPQHPQVIVDRMFCRCPRLRLVPGRDVLDRNRSEEKRGQQQVRQNENAVNQNEEQKQEWERVKFNLSTAPPLICEPRTNVKEKTKKGIKNFLVLNKYWAIFVSILSFVDSRFLMFKLKVSKMKVRSDGY